MEAEQMKASNEHVQTTSDQLKHGDHETPFTMEKTRELVSSSSDDPLLELKHETPYAMEKSRDLVSSPSNPPLGLKEETPLPIEGPQELVSSPSNPPLELKDETPFVIEKTLEEDSSPSNPPFELKHEDETPFVIEKTREEDYSPSNPDPPFELKHEDETPETITSSPCEDTTTSETTEMKSPLIQTPGYDPNRIPASIFSSKTGPGDWSATSNESLFSIHMGNNSFSRDYAILFGKSGELPKLDDWNGPQSNPFLGPGELPRLEEWNKPNYHHASDQGKPSEIGTLPPLLEVPSQEESSALSGEFSKKYEDVSPKFVSDHGTKHDVPAALRRPPLPGNNNNSSSNYPASFPSPSRLSDASAHSGSSFAFPVLAGNDSGKNDSLKVVPEKLAKPVKAEQPVAQNQSHFHSETPTNNITSTRWFSCFSHWPRFC